MLFNKKDPFERLITLKKGTWEYKICNYHNTNNDNKHGNSHPEMEKYYDCIKSSIEEPHFILRDTKIVQDENGEEIEIENENREEFIKFFFDDDNLCGIKTLVEFNNDKGDIVTSHKITGRIKGIKKGGGIIYDVSKK